MDEKSVKNQLNSKFSIIGTIIIISLVVLDTSLGLGLVPRLVTRFCYNSPNPTQVNVSQVSLNYLFVSNGFDFRVNAFFATTISSMPR